MKNKHLIVVSVDALVFEDLEYAKSLPMFGKILKEGSLVKRVTTIYPSLTHPVHASIMSGCPAGETGIIANLHFMPGQSSVPWYNYLSDMQCDTIFHAAHRAGLTTASCRWPLTGKGNDVIDYLLPEIMNTDVAGYEDHILDAYRNMGTSECLMDLIEEGVKRFGCYNEHPAYDAFGTFCAAEIIRRNKPNVLFTHPGLVDAERHRTGLFSDQVKESLVTTDRWISALWNAVIDAGIENETDLIVLSDHGHLSYSRTISPNIYLKDAGFIRVDEEGKLLGWDAYAAAGGLSSLVYLSRPEDAALYNSVYSLLRKMAEEGIYGFEQVFTREEVKEKYGLDGAFSFVLETDGCTGFGEYLTRPVVRPAKNEDVRLGHSSHGHLPEKGPQPTFLAMGPSIEKGVEVEHGHILDHAATFAKILGIPFPQAHGKAACFVK